MPHFGWRAGCSSFIASTTTPGSAAPVTDGEYEEASLANATVDAHREDPELGYRSLFDEVTAACHEVCERTVWKIC